jgi:hypothetical protein
MLQNTNTNTKSAIQATQVTIQHCEAWADRLKEIGKKITEQHTKHYEERKEFLNAEIEKRQEWIKNYEEKRRQIAGKNNISYYEAVRYISKGENEEYDTHSKFIPSLESERNTILQFTLPKYKRLSFQSTMHEFQGLFSKDIIDLKKTKELLRGLPDCKKLLKQYTPELHSYFISVLGKITIRYYTHYNEIDQLKMKENWIDGVFNEYSFYAVYKGVQEFLNLETKPKFFTIADIEFNVKKHHKEGLVLIANINWLLETSAETKRIN